MSIEIGLYDDEKAYYLFTKGVAGQRFQCI